jgi:hypothetical protein
MADVKATIGTPDFWICRAAAAKPPGAPDSYTDEVNFVNGKCGGPSTSGFIMKITFDDGSGGVPAGMHVVQHVVAAGIIGLPGLACGDRQVPFAFDDVEYFANPPVDFHWKLTCCEYTITATKYMQAVFMPLLPTAPAIPPGENMAWVPEADLQHYLKQVTMDHTLRWGMKYEYDGCNPPPAKPSTSCGKSQCLEVWVQPRTLAGLSPASQKFVLGKRVVSNFSN